MRRRKIARRAWAAIDGRQPAAIYGLVSFRSRVTIFDGVLL
jgi:hypothetical protein